MWASGSREVGTAVIEIKSGTDVVVSALAIGVDSGRDGALDGAGVEPTPECTRMPAHSSVMKMGRIVTSCTSTDRYHLYTLHCKATLAACLQVDGAGQVVMCRVVSPD
eukprot:m.445255 g.445255  ORF g.445255 m.445255 type:complete len:108 (-) comp143327_c0_seq1:182-505(-)